MEIGQTVEKSRIEKVKGIKSNGQKAKSVKSEDISQNFLAKLKKQKC